ncbi:hypothetical protein ACFQ3Z_36405 [Streptomyces nogalater]
MTGPQALTQREQVRAVGEGSAGPRLRRGDPGQARADLTAQGLPAPIADYVLAFQAGWTERPAPARPTVREVTGRPARTLAQWAADHRADFR